MMRNALHFGLWAWTLVFSTAAFGQTPGDSPQQLEIQSVEVVYAGDRPDQLVIKGRNFGSSPGVASVEGLHLSALAWTETQISGKLPSANMTPGSYVLTVSAGPAAVRRDTAGFTVGAAGPQGPAGPAGSSGGLAGYRVVELETVVSIPSAANQLPFAWIVSCPDEQMVLLAGVETTSLLSRVTLAGSSPLGIASGYVRTWRFTFLNGFNETSIPRRARLICTDPPPAQP